jgi:putative transposase
MTLYKNKYRIESTRLDGWDYSAPGYYFFTICSKNRECLFGEINNGKMVVNEFGRIVQNCWDELTNHYERIKLDEFIIMPNHVHGIIVICSDNDIVETGLKPVSTKNGFGKSKKYGLSEFVRALKTFSARRINKIRGTSEISIWQSRFYDRIIRDENELLMISEYIQNNHVKWEEDENYIL